MPTPRNLIIEYIEQGIIPADKIPDALKVTRVIPDGKSWRTFIDRLLLYIGGLALAFAVMFFIAYNWNDIGRFSKFGMVEAVIVIAIIAYCRLSKETASSKVSLLVASICVGVLLALYGQTYQTGADPWQLFFTWALFIIPWAVIGRFPAIWVLWAALINVSIILYYQAFGGVIEILLGYRSPMLWLLFLFNTLALFLWEFLSIKWRWLSERWAVRLLALGSGVPVTWLILAAIFHRGEAGSYSWFAWLIWLALIYFIYRKIKPDLFMLAEGCLSVITVIVCFIGRHILEHGEPGAFLFLAILVIGMGSGTAFWIKNIHKEIR
ncbi:MAG: DUF2157 domain-containing protein [Desulfobacteraceae bacterium]|jgi:uncharacterized membrane protein